MTDKTSSRDDFVHEPVPDGRRRSWWRIFAVWVGFIIVVGIMAVGGGMAAGMKLSSFLEVVFLGNAILGVLAAISGYVGARSGKSFAQLCAAVFPGQSSKIVMLYAPVTLIAWYAIECAIFGNLIGRILHLDPLGTRVAMAAAAALFCITTYLGFRGMQWLSVVIVPTLVALGAYAFYFVVTTGSGAFGFGPTPVSFNDGLGLVIGSWALGVVAAYPDIARFAKSPALGAWLGFLGIFIFNSLNFLVGAAGAALAKQYDPALILLAAGVPALALVMAIGNVWTTNDSNLYSASLGISKAFPISRTSAVILSAILSAAIAFYNPAQFTTFFTFLTVLGTTAPALGGVVLGGYFVAKDGTRPTSATAAWLGWAGGSAVSYMTSGVVSVPAGVIAGFVIWLLARAVVGPKEAAATYS